MESRLRRRNKKYLILLWSNIIIIGGISCFLIISFYEKPEEGKNEVLSTISYTLLMIETLFIAVLTLYALFLIYQILKSLKSNYKIKKLPIIA